MSYGVSIKLENLYILCTSFIKEGDIFTQNQYIMDKNGEAKITDDRKTNIKDRYTLFFIVIKYSLAFF